MFVSFTRSWMLWVVLNQGGVCNWPWSRNVPFLHAPRGQARTDPGAGVCRSAVEINFQVHLEQLDDLGERGMAPCIRGISVFFSCFSLSEIQESQVLVDTQLSGANLPCQRQASADAWWWHQWFHRFGDSHGWCGHGRDQRSASGQFSGSGFNDWQVAATDPMYQTLSLCPLDWTVEYYPSVLRETCRGWICSCRWIGIVDGDCGRSGNFVAGPGAWTFSSVKTFLDRLWFGGVFGPLVALSLCLLSTSHLHLTRNMQFNKWYIIHIRTIRY